MKKPFCKTLFFFFLVFFVTGLAGSALATTYVFKFPPGVTAFIGMNGAVYTPDSMGLTSVTDVSLVRNFLDGGMKFVGDGTFPVASHDYGAAAVNWTLSTKENSCLFITASNASGAVNAVIDPTLGQFHIVYNATGFTLTVKGTGQSGVAVANNGAAVIRTSGTDAVAIPTTGGPGSFTTLAASGNVTLSPTGSVTINPSTTVSIAPTGALTVNPTAASGMDNVAVGANTPLAGHFTTLDATGGLNSTVIGGTTPAAATVTTFGYGTVAAASHDYGGAHADWTLSAAEGRARSFTTTDAAGGGANAIVPATFVGIFFVNNTSGQTVTWKYAAGNGVANANTKKAVLVADGAEIYAVKSDY